MPGAGLRRLRVSTSTVAQDSTTSTPITYADAGVDIKRADRTKQRIKYLAHKTFNKNVLSEIGGFGALSAIPLKYRVRSWSPAWMGSAPN